MIVLGVYLAVGVLLCAQALYRGWKYRPHAWDDLAVEVAGAVVIWPALVVADLIAIWRERRAAGEEKRK